MLAVACHLHFWQNDPDRLRATTLTPREEVGWRVGRYRNKSQHRLTLEKKILPPLETFRSRIRRSTTELFQLPAVSDTSEHVSLPLPRIAWEMSETAGNLFALIFSQSSSSSLLKACISGVSEQRYAFIYFFAAIFFFFLSPLQVPSLKPGMSAFFRCHLFLSSSNSS